MSLFYRRTLWLLYSLILPVANTFNLDIVSPDIRTGPVDSLFGFSVVLSSTRQQWQVLFSSIVTTQIFTKSHMYLGPM